MLLFASMLHDRFITAKPQTTNVRMGVAFGETAFLLDNEFISVHGDTVNMAARMESQAIPGMVIVHRSAANRWACETCTHDQPTCQPIKCKGKEPQAAAFYDCVNHAFCNMISTDYDI